MDLKPANSKISKSPLVNHFWIFSEMTTKSKLGGSPNNSKCMATILLKTEIRAPIETVFDLSRNIDFHTVSVPGTGEKAIAGRTTGLIEQGETVTWSARHLGVRQKLTTLISEMDRPVYFCDVMLKGAFKSLRHEHHYEQIGDVTTMTDKMEFHSPFGLVGRFFNWIFLKGYMERFLRTRAGVLKRGAENRGAGLGARG
jgi:ligand-binding SRPBCC domain-containing protein